MEDEKDLKPLDKIKQIIAAGELNANKDRKAELQPKIDMADKVFQTGLLLFFLLFFIIIAVLFYINT